MQITRILCLLILLFSACKPKPQSPLALSVQYLWSQQSEDGGWHSPVHGIMKSGQAHTPFVMFALLQIPDSVYTPSEGQVKKGLDFIRASVNDLGAIGFHQPYVVEYPNYATAYALRVLSQFGNEGDKDLIQKMQNYLINQQFVETRGMDSSHYAYGSWGFGEKGIPKGYTGHIDISHTRKVVQALAESGLEEKAVFEKAQYFLRLVQKHPDEKRPQPVPGNTSPVFPEASYPYDGGFYSSPLILGANKAKYNPESGVFPSYATATCDGMLALLAAGWSVSSEPVIRANQWLKGHKNLNFPEGIPEDDPDQWHRVLVIYHLWVRSEVYQKLNWPEEEKKKLLNMILSLQNSDGSFANQEGSRNKEDDPLLATAMAVMGMNNLGLGCNNTSSK